MSRSQLPQALRATRTNWAAAGVAGALVIAVTAIGLPAAHSAKDSSCPAPYPEAKLTKGQSVHGLTVDGAKSATDPVKFTGTVIGVLQDGIAPGLDMIMTRLSSPAIDRVGGIWQGMSGSPVYSADGRLIGAVAYGLAAGPSPVAGVTPAGAMEALLSKQTATAKAAPARVALPRGLARTLVASGDATRSEVADGMSQLRVPFAVSGLTGLKRLHQARKLLHLRDVRLMSGGATGAGTARTPIVPGGNLAASLAYGDVTAAGIGTATAVCGSEVLGFGHPMLFSGPSTLTLHGAETLYVQEDSFAPFKVANVTGPEGTIAQDRLAGIRGSTGALPKATAITSYVQVGSRSRTGTTHISVPNMLPDLATMHLLADQDRVLDAIGPGSGQAAWTISGVRADGNPFRLVRTDMYASQFDISGTVAFTLFDTLTRLQNNGAVDVHFSGLHTSSRLNLQYRQYQLAQVQLRHAGGWATAPRHRPLRLHAGSVVALRVKLTSLNLRARWITLKVRVPAGAAGQFGSLEVLGGNSSGGAGNGQGLDAVLRQLRSAPHHNEVIARLHFGRTPSASGHTMASAVVDGGASFQVHAVR